MTKDGILHKVINTKVEYHYTDHSNIIYKIKAIKLTWVCFLCTFTSNTIIAKIPILEKNKPELFK